MATPQICTFPTLRKCSFFVVLHLYLCKIYNLAVGNHPRIKMCYFSLFSIHKVKGLPVPTFSDEKRTGQRTVPRELAQNLEGPTFIDTTVVLGRFWRCHRPSTSSPPHPPKTQAKKPKPYNQRLLITKSKKTRKH
jgi:hypothetical protein